jgi:hypothetical protein
MKNLFCYAIPLAFLALGAGCTQALVSDSEGVTEDEVRSRALDLLRSPFSGSIAEPRNALAAIRENTNFAKVAGSIAALEAAHPSLVAFAELKSTRTGVAHQIHYYDSNARGQLTPLADVQGELIGGDEFTLSRPGNASFRLAVGVAPLAISSRMPSAPRSPFAGYAFEARNALGMIASTNGFSRTSLSISELLKREPTTVALAEQQLAGDKTTFVIHFYRQRAGVLTPLATAEGSILGGDEFTESVPGSSTYRSTDAGIR